MTQEYKGREFEPVYCQAVCDWYALPDGKRGPHPRELAQIFVAPGVWLDLTSAPIFNNCNVTYRFKPAPPRTVTLGYRDAEGVEHWETMVAPERVEPAASAHYWSVDAEGQPFKILWYRTESYKGLLTANNVFSTKEAAQAMADFQRRARGCV